MVRIRNLYKKSSRLRFYKKKNQHLFQTQKIITKFTFSLRENHTNNYKQKKITTLTLWLKYDTCTYFKPKK